ncbi:hypothetical protein LCGC14_1404040, partial [marine sediment metagenome]
MNETDLILNCMSADTPKKKSQRTTKQIRHKSLQEWTGADFLKHINTQLSYYGLSLESTGARDSDIINRIYDNLVDRTDFRMSNMVLRDYLDWWIGSQAFKYRESGDSIYIHSFMKDYHLNKFVKEWKLKHSPVAEDDNYQP